MNRKVTARILNMDSTIIGWKEYAEGFYDPPTTNSSYLLFIGITDVLDSWYPWVKIKETMDYYSQYMDQGSICLFFLATSPNDLFGDIEKGWQARVYKAIKYFSDYKTDLGYYGTIIYSDQTKYEKEEKEKRKDPRLVITQMLYDAANNHGASGAYSSPILTSGVYHSVASIAEKNGFAHFVFSPNFETRV